MNVYMMYTCMCLRFIIYVIHTYIDTKKTARMSGNICKRVLNSPVILIFKELLIKINAEIDCVIVIVYIWILYFLQLLLSSLNQRNHFRYVVGDGNNNGRDDDDRNMQMNDENVWEYGVVQGLNNITLYVNKIRELWICYLPTFPLYMKRVFSGELEIYIDWFHRYVLYLCLHLHLYLCLYYHIYFHFY